MKTPKLLFALFLVIALAACAGGRGSMPNPQPVSNVVHIDSAELVLLTSFPPQVRLLVTGNLPSPCHGFESDVAPTDDRNQIHVSVRAEVLSGPMCAAVLEPFEEGIAIPMDGAAAGTYSVWLNGELVGEFSYP
ncbi:MAG: hypothetical protein KIS85_08985 [Anaerolineales bacterium]|nr:hypothetical protein [Anaerolineales bacterium]